MLILVISGWGGSCVRMFFCFFILFHNSQVSTLPCLQQMIKKKLMRGRRRLPHSELVRGESPDMRGPDLPQWTLPSLQLWKRDSGALDWGWIEQRQLHCGRRWGGGLLYFSNNLWEQGRGAYSSAVISHCLNWQALCCSGYIIAAICHVCWELIRKLSWTM